MDNIGLTVTAGFNPQLLLGISILGHDATAGLGVFLDLPSVSATLEQVAHVNSKCEPQPLSSSSTPGSVATEIFDSLTHIKGDVGFDIGVLAQANLNIDGASFNENASYTAFATSYPLPTACISFDSKSKTYGVAGASVSASGTGNTGQIGKTDQKSDAVSSFKNPVLEVLGKQRRMELAAGILMLVSAGFATL